MKNCRNEERKSDVDEDDEVKTQESTEDEDAHTMGPTAAQLGCILSEEVDSRIDTCLMMIMAAMRDQRPANDKSNYQRNKAIQFYTPHPKTQIRFYDMFSIRARYPRMFRALYFIRDCHEKDTYLLFIRLYGYVHRTQLTKVLTKLVQAMCDAPIELQVCTIKTNASTSNMANVMREKAGFKKHNIYMMIHDDLDAPIVVQPQMHQIDMTKCFESMKRVYLNNMTNICLAPRGYGTALRDLQNMSASELRTRLKERDIDTIYQEVQGQVFDMTVIEVATSENQQLILGDECVKLQLCTFMHEKVYSLFLMCALGSLNAQVDHPPFYYSVQKHLQALFSAPTADVAVYHPNFLVPLLLMSRYVARVCMQSPDKISSNGATLLLQGAAGAGKTMLCNALVKYASGYKWNAETNYQTPQLLSSSLVLIEEVRLGQLTEPLLKQILDFMSYAKVEIKNAHPVDATRHCPVIMNTNEDVFDFLRTGISQGGGRASFGRPSGRLSDEQLKAVRRRFVIVPFTDKFERLHEPSEAVLRAVRGASEQYLGFSDLERTSPAMFNFFLAFGLHQSELRNHEVVPAMKSYMHKLALDFASTVFGQTYFAHRELINALLATLEDKLRQPVEQFTIQHTLSRTILELERLINEMYLTIMARCPNKAALDNIWHQPHWTETNHFLRKLVISRDPDFKQQTFREPPQPDMIAPQWQRLLQASSGTLVGDATMMSEQDFDMEKKLDIRSN